MADCFLRTSFFSALFSFFNFFLSTLKPSRSVCRSQKPLAVAFLLPSLIGMTVMGRVATPVPGAWVMTLQMGGKRGLRYVRD